MEIAMLGLGMAATSQGAVYLPFSFDGNFTEEEKAVIVSAIAPHVPEKADSMFNDWLFSHPDGCGEFFMCKRSTWNRVSCFKSAQEVADFITKYYSE